MGEPTRLEVLRVPEAARLLGVSRDALYEAIKRGEVPHRRIGRRILLCKEVLLEWFQECEPWAQEG